MNRKAINAIFDLADKESASFAEQLLEQGIASRTDARPFAIEWASKKHNEPIKDGQRGLTFVRRGTAAEQAVTRVLQVCYPSADTKPAKPKRKTANKTDAVAQLFAKWEALSGAEKRRFARMQIER